MSRRISILGATGSVGTATLDLVSRATEGTYQIVALTAHSNVEELARLAKKFRPEIAVIADESRAGDLADALAGTGVETAGGEAALIEAASRPRRCCRFEADCSGAAAGIHPGDCQQGVPCLCRRIVHGPRAET